jgi:hypothetical protein
MADRKAHDERPPIAHVRVTEDNFDAFLFVPGCYETVGKPERLRVLSGTKTMTCVRITEERTTSESKTAEVFSGGELSALNLTTEQAEWLYEALGRALTWRKEWESR